MGSDQNQGNENPGLGFQSQEAETPRYTKAARVLQGIWEGIGDQACFPKMDL